MPPLLTADEVRDLTEVGFLAVARVGSSAQAAGRATAIFGALRRLRPDRGFPVVGLAMTQVAQGHADAAATLLEEAHASVCEADRVELNAFRGFSLWVAGRASESSQALRAALPHPLACHMLGVDASENPAEAGYKPTITGSLPLGGTWTS